MQEKKGWGCPKAYFLPRASCMLLSAGCAVSRGGAEGLRALSVMQTVRNWSGRRGVGSVGSRGRRGVASCLKKGSESVRPLVCT
jgi:hypothetical protein